MAALSCLTWSSANAVTSPLRPAPASRLRLLREQAPRAGARYVLYWMIAARRLTDNFGVQHAAWWAAQLDLPLLVFEPLRSEYPWASDRFHAFVLQGMAEHASQAAQAGVTYLPYVEPAHGAGKGLLEALAKDAAVVVTDDFPAFFLPRMLEAAARRIDCRLEAIDSNGLLPMRATTTVYPTAYAFRRYVQKVLPAHLADVPAQHPLASLSVREAPVRAEILRRWPRASLSLIHI